MVGGAKRRGVKLARYQSLLLVREGARESESQRGLPQPHCSSAGETHSSTVERAEAVIYKLNRGLLLSCAKLKHGSVTVTGL